MAADKNEKRDWRISVILLTIWTVASLGRAASELSDLEALQPRRRRRRAGKDEEEN